VFFFFFFYKNNSVFKLPHKVVVADGNVITLR
jgi:hypothetical protein